MDINPEENEERPEQTCLPRLRHSKQTEVTRYYRRSGTSIGPTLTGRKRPLQTPDMCKNRDAQSPMPPRRISTDINPEDINGNEERLVSGQKRDRVSPKNDMSQNTILKYFTKSSS